MFSGQATPPMNLPDSQAVIKVVMENKGAIGYVDSEMVNENDVQVLFHFEER